MTHTSVIVCLLGLIDRFSPRQQLMSLLSGFVLFGSVVGLILIHHNHQIVSCLLFMNFFF